MAKLCAAAGQIPAVPNYRKLFASTASRRTLCRGRRRGRQLALAGRAEPAQKIRAHRRKSRRCQLRGDAHPGGEARLKTGDLAVTGNREPRASKPHALLRPRKLRAIYASKL